MQATQLRNVRCAGLVFLPALGGHTGHGRPGNTLLATIISNGVSWHKDMGHNKCRNISCTQCMRMFKYHISMSSNTLFISNLIKIVPLDFSSQ